MQVGFGHEVTRGIFVKQRPEIHWKVKSGSNTRHGQWDGDLRVFKDLKIYLVGGMIYSPVSDVRKQSIWGQCSS